MKLFLQLLIAAACASIASSAVTSASIKNDGLAIIAIAKAMPMLQTVTSGAAGDLTSIRTTRKSSEDRFDPSLHHFQSINPSRIHINQPTNQFLWLLLSYLQGCRWNLVRLPGPLHRPNGRAPEDLRDMTRHQMKPHS